MSNVNGGFKLSTSRKRAREILGKNRFGIKEAIRHFGVDPSYQQIVALAKVPFPERVLEECKDTYTLVADFPLSILDIRRKMNSNKMDPKLFHNQSWYNKKPLAKDYGEVVWQLVRKTPIPNSTSQNWAEQQALLAKNEETPKARVMVYAIIGYCLATGERLFEDVRVRCSDVNLNNGRAAVCFGAEGLKIENYWNNCRLTHLSVSSVKKPA